MQAQSLQSNLEPSLHTSWQATRTSMTEHPGSEDEVCDVPQIYGKQSQCSGRGHSMSSGAA